MTEAQTQYLTSNLHILSAEVMVPGKGVGSYREIIEFVQDTLDARTEVHDDTTSAKLAEGIVQSILNRLRIGF